MDGHQRQLTSHLAENYYTNDYPDEDLDWDDELNHNAYHYLDPEEFDERDYDAEELDHPSWSDAFWEQCERDGSKLQ
jgi:hypothetical protein